MQGARDYTVLHETYEIMHETLCDLETGAQPEEEVCRQADQLADQSKEVAPRGTPGTAALPPV